MYVNLSLHFIQFIDLLLQFLLYFIYIVYYNFKLLSYLIIHK
nr:MAG TPA: hypothetical protein [Caudoviricetes sp.]